ncbi:uncharacterized protein TA19850 [Theileria annulata]|uniref:Optic atrophy 3 protein (OPA3) n=1 Tax=Theileria annulata TaxID=5874 RepID=Q4UG15_THEAN|nr:uncharacterized protein TA19850 [Theileria annulata]CAI73974.1 hypothetical protein, conserved [Theileria annulata]|eukprot:XP_954651.1 hypothetical protein, conserved [Theileria annulata]
MAPNKSINIMFPAYKVLCVFIRQISKPFANYLKRRAAHNERFRNICIYFGNRSFAFERSISRRFYNSEVSECDKVTLSPEKSVNIGSELLGECFIFTVAAGLITAEYIRGVLKESRKEYRLKQRLDNIDSRQGDLQKLINQEVTRQLEARFPAISTGERKF